MSLTLSDVRRIATDVARQQNPALEVAAVTTTEGEASTYAEVILMVHGCRVEPCRLVIGVSRTGSELECRGEVKAGLAQHLEEHRMPSAP